MLGGCSLQTQTNVCYAALLVGGDQYMLLAHGRIHTFALLVFTCVFWKREVLHTVGPPQIARIGQLDLQKR